MSRGEKRKKKKVTIKTQNEQIVETGICMYGTKRIKNIRVKKKQ